MLHHAVGGELVEPLRLFDKLTAHGNQPSKEYIMKKLLEFKLDNGESVFMQIEDTETRPITPRSGNDTQPESTPAQRSFTEAIRCISPVANTLLSSLKNINQPDEIKLEFGLTFNAKAGVIFTSMESEASFKVGITWKNKTE